MQSNDNADNHNNDNNDNNNHDINIHLNMIIHINTHVYTVAGVVTQPPTRQRSVPLTHAEPSFVCSGGTTCLTLLV